MPLLAHAGMSPSEPNSKNATSDIESEETQD